MGNVGRRLDKIEAAFAPPVTDEVRSVIERILADAPQLPRPTDPAVLATIARLKELDLPRPKHPYQMIELAKRMAEGQRRLAAINSD